MIGVDSGAVDGPSSLQAAARARTATPVRRTAALRKDMRLTSGSGFPTFGRATIVLPDYPPVNVVVHLPTHPAGSPDRRASASAGRSPRLRPAGRLRVPSP